MAASVLVLVVIAMTYGLSSLLNSHHVHQRAAAITSSHSPASTVGGITQTDPKYAAAPLKRLGAISKADEAGHIARPWNVLKTNNADAHVEIVFASRSRERVDGVDFEQTPTTVAINVLATNIVGYPTCDVVPQLFRAVLHLAAPLHARSLIHTPIDKTYWPTNPFDRH